MKYALTLSTILGASLLAAAPASAGSSQGWIYFTEPGSDLIKRAHLDGTGVEVVLSALDGVLSPNGITLDSDNAKLYWTTNENPVKVQRSELDGASPVTLVQSREDNHGDIVLDVAAGKMYWLREIASQGKLYRANLDGSNVELLLEPQGPRALAIDIAAGKLYLGTTPGFFCGAAGKIQRMNLDGSGIEDIVPGSGNVVSIIVDSINQKLLWCATCPPDGIVIKRANLDGSQIETFLAAGASGLAIDAIAQKLYWTEGQKIRRANLADGSDIQDVITFIVGGAQGIAVLAAPETNPADLSGDGVVNGIDLALLLGQWGRCPAKGACTADLNGDDVVNGIDLALLLGAWG